MTVSSQDPVPSYAEGYPEFTKYVPFSDVELPHEVITGNKLTCCILRTLALLRNRLIKER